MVAIWLDEQLNKTQPESAEFCTLWQSNAE